MEHIDTALSGGLEWYQDPITQTLVRGLKEAINSQKENWSAGAFTGPTEYETIQKNSQALGYIQALDLILEIIEDIGGVLNNA